MSDMKESHHRYRHGLAHGRFNNIFFCLRARCRNAKIPCYKHYGGRGIKCLWDYFEEFKNDMYESYLVHVKEFGERNTQIDRIDNDGNYCKENCQWATLKEQGNNRTDNIRFTVYGQTMSLDKLSEKYEIKYSTLYNRIKKLGWDSERAVDTPVNRKYIKHNLTKQYV